MAGIRPLRAAALAVVAVLALLAPAAPAQAASGSSAPRGTATPTASYTPVGTPVGGGGDAAGSTALSQPGQYTDSLAKGSADSGADGSVKYYSISLHKGDKAFLTATVVPPDRFAASGSLSLEVVITSVDESLCYFQDQNYESEQGNTLTPLSVVLATGEVGGPDWDNDCPATGGTFTVKVTRSGDAFKDDSMPLELGLHFEPKVVTSGVPGIAASQSDVPISAGTDQLRDIDAGYSYNDAPEVGTGRYQDTISSGETRYLRVPLDWGQRMSFFVASGQVSGNGGDGVTATAALFNPIRTPLTLADGTPYDFESGFGGSDAQLSGSTKVLVRYANRESTNDGIAPYSIAGDYFVALTLGYADDGTSLTVPYTIQLQVIGAPEQAPSYSYSPVADSGSGGDGGSGALIWVLVVVLVVVVAVIAWLLLRRRTPAHAGAAAVPPQPAGHRRTGRTGSPLGSAPTTGIPARNPRPSVPQQQGRSSVPPGPGRPSVPPGSQGPAPQGPAPQGRPPFQGPPQGPPRDPRQGPQQGPPQGPPHGPPSAPR